ncbi:MAG: two-component sensor histidine kinase, partial [Tetrasphaera sp.]|nr:two-component sensor histidine kinase [Tetrasphaera sp.]
ALPEDERVAALARARLALDRLGYVVDDLLVLSRMDERTAVTPETEIDLDDVVLRAVRALPTTDERITLALEPARVVADPKLWDRLVRNLLDNADRHAHSHIRVTLRREAAGAVLEVDNDGPPVPEAERVRIFERFVRLDAARARDAGGSGLGLAIVAAVAERAGGRASAGETPEGWCRFRIEVPVAPG